MVGIGQSWLSVAVPLLLAVYLCAAAFFYLGLETAWREDGESETMPRAKMLLVAILLPAFALFTGLFFMVIDLIDKVVAVFERRRR
jgi:hypothetical protein